MNTGYVLWFAVLVAVAGAALVWLAIGVVPEIPPEQDSGPVAGAEPGAAGTGPPGGPRAADDAPPAPEADLVLASEPELASDVELTSEPDLASEPGTGSRPGSVSEHAVEDRIARGP